MIERPQSATLYVWEKNQPFNIDYLIFILGGIRTPSDAELSSHHIGNPMYCTDDFRLYPITKEQDTETRRKHQGSMFESMAMELYPHFRTVMLKDRFKKLGLPVPNNEITFCPRGNSNNFEGIDVQKIRAAAAHLTVYSGLDVLCVPGTDIEHDQYLASELIAEKLGIEMVPGEACAP